VSARTGLRRALRIWAILLASAAIAVTLALSVGSVAISPAAVLRALFGGGESVARDVVERLRLPRALAAFATGGLLAYAGALMQVLLRNPLADPYVLGLSGGAAVGALAAMMLGLGGVSTDVAAFAGALLSGALVFGLAYGDLSRLRSSGEAEASPRLLLTGVILAAGWSAMITLLLSIAPDAQLRGMLFWLMGDLDAVARAAPALVALAVIVPATYPWSRDLNVMLRGDVVAHSLGVQVQGVRRAAYVLAALATALAVTTAGTVGFVGLIVPHALRLVIGNDQRVLLPASAVTGGTFLLLADTAARSVIAPQQIPVGVVTALLGVPVFMFLLLRRRAA